MEVVKKDKAGVITVRNPTVIAGIMQAVSTLIDLDGVSTGLNNCCLVQYAQVVQKQGEQKGVGDLKFYMGESVTQVLNNKLSEAVYQGMSFCLETLINKQEQRTSNLFNDRFFVFI